MRPALGDRELLEAIEAMVRRRVPPSEVEDIVQSALADAVASQDAPSEPEALRRWLSGVVRHKVADFYRRSRRERTLDDAPERSHAPPHEDRDLLRWATRQLPAASPDAERTLEWMMHEADGEKLESIAERERLPAERVRQRVSRLRAFFRERWRREIALAAAAITLVAIGWMLSRVRPQAPPIAHDPVPPTPAPVLRAKELRMEANDACAERSWRRCIDKIDEARRLDVAGETDELRRARDEAVRALDATSPVAPTPSSSSAPAPTAPLAPFDIRKSSKESEPPMPRAQPTAAPSQMPAPPPKAAPARGKVSKPSAPDPAQVRGTGDISGP